METSKKDQILSKLKYRNFRIAEEPLKLLTENEHACERERDGKERGNAIE